ncbi:MAG: calcium/sodium antiporter [Xanthomonadales bacterium]|nr:calcium/sodium antiporter [Gammaproteobacteria bacterium]MBT8074830.1 calcium/sodium antiporter [Gammaproteobacteria bacterium]NNK05517.1 calcium/sodium antiporter [Xanthomonadales bacterium]NNK97958.1 calcium/sodium antiporter [Xanthomonadales bacterium]
MLIAITQLAAGFLLLVWGADRLVAGASATARNLGVSPLIIGLTIIGFGTSAPELVVSAVATMKGNSGLAIGNAIGSNIANMGLVLGATALIYPLRMESTALKREYPMLLLVMLVCFLMALNGLYSHYEGWALLAGLFAVVIWIIRIGLHRPLSDPLAEEFDAEIPKDTPTKTAVFWLLVGLVVLPISSTFLVDGAITIARHLHVSDTVIGLTVVALGTSLPELATAVTAALHKEDDLAIGNIIGSNIFNLLGVLGIAAVIQPVELLPVILARDFPAMFLMTGALYLMASDFRGPGRIGRRSGSVLLIMFAFYFTLVWMSSFDVPSTLAN